MNENEEVFNEEIKAIFLEKGKISAIKEYCEKTGEGLKESKFEVERIVESLRDEYPERFKSGGCAAVVLIGLLGLSMTIGFIA